MDNLILKKEIKLRAYQENVLENVLKKGSSLVVIPTGLGKTIIAISLISALNKRKPIKVLFLAPTKPLVEQHFQTLKEFFEGNIEMLTGTIKKEKRKKLIEENQIIVATPQTINNHLNELLENCFDLIIFDEAHRATGDYAYVNIAKHFDSFNLGLTASPGTTKSKIKEIMQNLKIENLEIKRETDSDVLPYVNPIKINWVKVNLPLPLKQVNELLKEFINDNAQILKKMGLALRKDFTQRDLLLIQKKIFAKLKEKNPQPELYQAISIVSAIMKIEHAITLLETQGISALKEYLERLGEEENTKAAKKINKDDRIKKAKYIVEGLNLADVEHPKIKKLEEIILNEFDKDPDQKIIVFNHYRDSVQNLEKELNKNPLISAKMFVGQANKGTNKGLNQKQQKQVIEEFKEGKYNVLLATSVAEEGLDIPSVDTVIFYEPVPSDIRSIQRRGRTGRFKEGKVYVLITVGTRDEAFYWASRQKEKNMMKALTQLSQKETLSQKINKIVEEKPKIEKPKAIKQKLITEILKQEQEKKDEIVIFVDKREKKSKTFEELKKKECRIEEKQLEIGDYQVGEETIIERKTINDFIASIIDGRLFNQAVKMSVYEKPVFLIEGNFEYALEERNIRKSQIYGTLFTLMLEFKIPVLFALDSFEASEIIYLLAKREQLKKDKPISLRKLKKIDDSKLMKQYIVEGLPYVGPKLAIRLLEKFKNVKRIFNAEARSLEKIEGIGKKKAEEIYKIINENYE